MSNKQRHCILCKKNERTNRSRFTRVYPMERAEKLLEGYRRQHNGKELDQPIFNQLVHKKCYNNIVRNVCVANDPDTSTNIFDLLDVELDDRDEEQDQTPIIQNRSRMPLPSHVNKHLIERRQRACVVCNRYNSTLRDKIKQIVSNYMANQIAEALRLKYGRSMSQSLLDAYIHETCMRKLHRYYHYHVKSKSIEQNQSRYITSCAKDERNCSNVNESQSDADGRSIISMETASTMPDGQLIETNNAELQLSALSCLFRPCMERLKPEEIEFYTKRSKRLELTEIDNISTTKATDQSVITQNLVTNDLTIDDDCINEPDTFSVSHATVNNSQKINTTAAIRLRHMKPPPLAKPTNPLQYDHIFTKPTYVPKPPPEIEKLFDWLMEQFNSSENPLSMGDVSKKYIELCKENYGSSFENPKRESAKRERVKNLIEKFYPKKFVFVTPKRSEGTFIGINNIDRYVELAIKYGKEQQEKIIEPLISSTTTTRPTPVDLQRQTCEEVMNAIRKIRLYIRDSEQIHRLPPLLLRNTIGLITASERQFDKILHQYDFYKMIDDDLFETENNNKISNHSDRNVRILSLASDIISARHEHRISQKHYLLADEIAKEDFCCTPRQVITLLNRYGHTCSYRRYVKTKVSQQKAISELGEELERLMADEENDILDS